LCISNSNEADALIDFDRIVKGIRQAPASAALLSFALFIVMDFAIRVGSSWHKEPDMLTFDTPYRSRAYWAIKDFLQQKSPPDILLIGPSDVAAALTRSEATYLNRRVEEMTTHRSQYLEKKLRDLDSPYKSTSSLAIPGEMPSDTYFLFNTLVKNKKPQVIFLSFTPRNLCDATFGAPANTDIFKVLSKLGGLKDYQLSCRSSFWERVDYMFSQACSVYDHKWELTTWQHHLAHAMLGQSFDFSRFIGPDSIRKMSLLELPEDFGLGESITHPYDPKNAEYLSNINEYRQRYKRFNRKLFDQQLAFFKQFCRSCQSEGVQLVVGNSPITQENKQLLPKPIYNLCISEASKAVRESGGTWVDLDRPDVFQHDDFYDSVHLNGKGGLKYFDLISSIVGNRSFLATKKSQGL